LSQEKIPTRHYENLGGINEKASKYQTGLMEFLNLVNYDLNTPGAISKRPGSTQFMVSGVSGTVTGIHEFQRLGGFSQVVLSAGTGLYSVTAGRTASPIQTGRADNGRTDFQTFVDWMWLANGQTFLKYDGANLQPFGVNVNFAFFGGNSTSGSSSGVFLAPRYMIGFVNSRGFYSQVSRQNITLFDRISQGGCSSVTLALTLPAAAATAGVSFFAIYRNDDFNISGVSYFPGNIRFNTTGVFYLAALVNAGATLFTDTGGATSLVNSPIVADLEFYFPTYNNIDGTTTIARVPQLLELHQNSMFMAGFSFTPSVVWFSELGDPESIQPDYNFEVRTDDGDQIRGIKSFNNQLLVFKDTSFHKVIGDNPTNYELSEISSEYGAVSDQAIVTIDGVCYFLDEKGIIQYNGSSWDLISDRMESTFRRMNLAAAKGKAVAVHYSFRHQIWFSFPIDGATTNNMTVVYDYKAKAFFKFEGFQPSALKQMYAGLGSKNLFMGTYSGMIHHFSPSFLADNGVAMSMIAQPRFDQPQGQNNTAQFRRLWLDSDPVTAGMTGVINVTLLRDMSNTGITTMSIYQNQFQSRIEFGVQAKAIGFIFAHRHQSLPCTINGWVVAHRVLREL
jgi:hypothetical protein